MAPVEICGDLCWIDSFVIDGLISAGGGLLSTPTELGSVSVGAVDFIVRVDKKLWIEFGLF